MDLNVKLLCWEEADRNLLDHAFVELWDSRILLKARWDQQNRDLEYWKKTRPERLRSFLELLANETGCEVAELEHELPVLQACTFARQVQSEDAVYLHSYFFYDQSFMTMMAAWLLDIPRGISCYVDHMLDDYPFKLVRLHLELTDIVVATSQRIKEELLNISDGCHENKILIKPNGADGARFPFIERPASNVASFNLLSASRIEPKKGLIDLVESVDLLRQKQRNVCVHLVGDKDQFSPFSVQYAEALQRRIEALGLQEYIVMHGFLRQHEILVLIAKSHAFVAPYVETERGDKDGIPTSILEAMASGLPVISTDAGSIPEVINHEREGFILPQRDPARLAQAIECLMDDAPLASRIARAARYRFDREFDAQVIEHRLHERVQAVLRCREETHNVNS